MPPRKKNPEPSPTDAMPPDDKKNVPATPEIPDGGGKTPKDEFTPADTLGKELEGIYGDESAARVAAKTIDHAPGMFKKKLLIGLVIFLGVLAAVAWAGFFFFADAGGKFTGERVALEVAGPFSPKGGDLVTYDVSWKNDEHIPLGTASLALRLPKDFMVAATEPAPSDALTWTIGSIASGSTGHIEVSGTFFSAVNKTSDIQAILTYRPADFNSDFQKVTTRPATVTGSVLNITVSGPTKILPGDKATFDIAYENTSAVNAFDKIEIKGIYPDGFIPDATDPATAGDDKTAWVIPKLEPGGKGAVHISGTFASDANGTMDMKAQIGFLRGDGQDFALQNEATFATDVLQGDLVAALILNGSTENQTAKFGDTLRYALTYRNAGESTLGDVELAVVTETEPTGAKLLEWNALKDARQGVRDGGRITWTKKQVTSLGSIEAGKDGVIEFEVPLATAPLDDVTGNDYRITSWIEAKIGSIGGDSVNRVTKSQPIVMRINSDTTMSAGARYFSEDNIPLGSGPLPPKVGEPTTYRVTWHIANTFHELADLKLSTKLPENVLWNGKSSVDAGDLRFDAGDGKMLWTLNWLPTTITTLEVSYDLTITPSANQVGKIAPLTDAILFEAKDKVTGDSLLLASPPLTTAVENDEFAVGKGKVVGQ